MSVDFATTPFPLFALLRRRFPSLHLYASLLEPILTLLLWRLRDLGLLRECFHRDHQTGFHDANCRDHQMGFHDATHRDH